MAEVEVEEGGENDRERWRGQKYKTLVRYLIGKKIGRCGSNCDFFSEESDRRSAFFLLKKLF